MQIDYSKYKTAPAEPEASCMIETFRAIGYNIETAIADIVDNSISASARNVWINFEWRGSETWLSIKDDGIGMDNDELINALRPGSKNPLEDRSHNDLGRFGLGLKTASFSQARILTVISKKNEQSAVFWTWNLDYVKDSGKWNLIDLMPPAFTVNVFGDNKSGTIVIWNEIDRIVKHFKQDDTTALGKL
jgi:hypothetical protein